jgi:hypothetical protein
MKKPFSFLLLLLFSVAVSAQGIDLSGTWKLNKSLSKLNDQFSMAPKEIIVAQNGIDLNLEKHATFQDQDFTINDKFTLDGKECINPAWQDAQKKSTAVWDEDKASLKITSKIPMGDNGEMTVIEVYKLDGNKLVIETSASSSFGDVAEIQIFEKQ